MRSIMKNTLLSILFCAVLIALLVVSSSLIPTRYGSVVDELLAEPDHTVDVLMLGDSEAFCSMIPLKLWDEYGFTSYCCATSSQIVSNSAGIVRATMNSQSFQTVILETNCLFREMTYERVFFNFVATKFPVSELFHGWKIANRDRLGLRSSDTISKNTCGYKFSATVKPADATQYMTPSSEKETIPSANRSCVENMASYCKSKGATFVLISTPSTTNWNMKKHNATAAFAKELGVAYLDMNLLTDELGIDWENDTLDTGDHMNYFGAQKVTAYLGKYLSDNGLATDRSNDSKYASWNTVSANFRKTIAPYLTDAE